MYSKMSPADFFTNVLGIKLLRCLDKVADFSVIFQSRGFIIMGIYLTFMTVLLRKSQQLRWLGGWDTVPRRSSISRRIKGKTFAFTLHF